MKCRLNRYPDSRPDGRSQQDERAAKSLDRRTGDADFTEGQRGGIIGCSKIGSWPRAGVTKWGWSIAKKKKAAQSKMPRQTSRDSDADAITEKLLGYFTAAYVLDAAGMLDKGKLARLNSLAYPNCPRWDQAVEAAYGISRTFVRSVYALCTEINSPAAAVIFILRGLGCPDFQERLNEVVGD